MNLRSHSGYTLLEVIVVLVLLTIAAAVVAPSLYTVPPTDAASLGAVIRRAREAAVRRGELVRLHVGRSGSWEVSAGSNAEMLLTGRLQGGRDAAVDLVFSPLGSCGPAPEGGLQMTVEVDPLTCEVRSR